MKPFRYLPFLILMSFGLCTSAVAQDTMLIPRTILFPSGQHRIRPAYIRELQRDMDAMVADSPMYVRIEGHSDSLGNYARNKLLSMQRARFVQQWLVSRGFYANNISLQAWGPDRPAADNRTREGRRKNRRVDVVFMKISPGAGGEITPELPDIAGLYQQIGTPRQRFCINPSVDTVIRCEKGTVIYIRAGAFALPADCNDNCVSFSVKEDYLPSDMILDDLSTMSDGNVLETQGMVYTEAVDCHGNKLGLQNGKDLVMLMPMDTVNPNTKVFKGARNEDSIMNWTIDDSSVLSDLSLQDLIQCGRLWVDAMKSPPCKTCSFFFCRIGRVGKAVKGMFSAEQRALNRDFRQCQRDLNKPAGPEPDRKCPALAALFKKYGVDNTDSLMKAICRPLLDRYKVNTMAQLVDTLEKLGDKASINFNGQAIPLDKFRYYVFNTPRTGWGNLDWLMAPPPFGEVTVKLNISAQRNIQCKLVCRNGRVVIPATRAADKLEIRRAPRSEKGVIVALKYEDGQPVLGMKEITIGEEPFELDWKKVSKEELKEELKKLDR